MNVTHDKSIYTPAPATPQPLAKTLEEAKKKAEAMQHSEILQVLKKDFTPINFKTIIYPQAKRLFDELKTIATESEKATEIQNQLDKYKVTAKQYRIKSISHILETAKAKEWGLCRSFDFIYLYNGEYWLEMDKDEFQTFLGEAAEKVGVKWDNAQDFIFREQLFKQFLSVAYLKPPKPKRGITLVNLKNGTIEISNKGYKLRPFDRKDFIKYQLSFDYDPNATAPIFDKFLNEVLPDIERQRVLAEYLGYVFLKHGNGSLKLEKALLLYGSGGNGKSVIFEVVTALFGRTNVSNYSIQSLTEEKGFYRAKIANQLLNYCSDIGTKLETNLFKNMVSGEPIEACLKYGQPFDMADYAKLMFNCNELPRDAEQTMAYFRRFIIIHFDVEVPKENQDGDLHNKIIDSELSGVFNWVLEGLTRLLKQQGFSKSKAIDKMLETYMTESDSVMMFLNEEGYERSTLHEVAAKAMYDDYKAFCIDCNYRPVANQKFYARIRKKGIETTRKKHGTVIHAVKK
jgi:putative DNA primase/helicase